VYTTTPTTVTRSDPRLDDDQHYGPMAIVQDIDLESAAPTLHLDNGLAILTHERGLTVTNTGWVEPTAKVTYGQYLKYA